MSTTEAVLLIILAGLVALILGNIGFQLAAERRIRRSAFSSNATECGFTISNGAMPRRLAWSCSTGMAP